MAGRAEQHARERPQNPSGAHCCSHAAAGFQHTARAPPGPAPSSPRDAVRAWSAAHEGVSASRRAFWDSGLMGVATLEREGRRSPQRRGLRYSARFGTPPRPRAPAGVFLTEQRYALPRPSLLGVRRRLTEPRFCRAAYHTARRAKAREQQFPEITSRRTGT